MSLARRRFLHLAGSAAALPILPALSGHAFADAYPSRPLHLFVGYAPGSAPDIVARLIGQSLSDRLGQAVIVENKPGAGTILSTEAVVRAAPDGYTLLTVATPNMISGLLHANLSFEFIRDIAPVGCIGLTPFVMIINPEFPAKTVAEFIAYAKANPGKINMASNGTGNLTHVSGELFKMMTGVNLVHVPYRGDVEAQADLISGRAQVMFSPIISAMGHIKAGSLRALAVTTKSRLDSMPDVPTVGETVPGYEVLGGLGLGAPSATPPDIIDRLSRELAAGVGDDKVKSRLIDLGNIPTVMTPAQYRALLVSDTEKWAKVIKFADIKLN